MTKTFFISFFSTLLLSCHDKSFNNQKTEKLFVFQTKNIVDSLSDYFYKNEIEPEIIINNTGVIYGNYASKKEVSFLNHKIKWLDNESETTIQIDNDLFSLKKAVTLNDVEEGKVDSVDFANDWDQIKYFRSNDIELVGIRMSFYPCTGNGCSVSYFLLYEFKRKTKNYFGTYRTDDELKLYHFNNNSQYDVDYLSKTYNDLTDSSGEKTEVDYELFSLSDKGTFILQKDKQATPYTITHTFSDADTTSFEETLQSHWFEKIK